MRKWHFAQGIIVKVEAGEVGNVVVHTPLVGEHVTDLLVARAVFVKSVKVEQTLK